MSQSLKEQVSQLSSLLSAKVLGDTNTLPNRNTKDMFEALLYRGF